MTDFLGPQDAPIEAWEAAGFAKASDSAGSLRATLGSQAVSTTGLAELARDLVAGNQVVPFGPGIPIATMLPEEDEPRRWDYPTGFNIPMAPRTYEPITFAVLRALARNYDVAQLAIQKRIDGLRKLKWVIRPKAVAGMKRAEASARAARLEDAIAEVTGFFSMPDQEHDFPDWLSRALYDAFSIDAMTIFPRPTLGGELYGLEVIDGATIRPIIDGYGRPPAPPQPAYAQVIKGTTREMLSRDQLIYAPFWARSEGAYGHPPMEWILLAVNRALRRQSLDLTLYTEGNMPVAFLKLASDMPGAQIKELKTFLDELVAGNDVARSRIIPIPGGSGTGLDRMNPEPTTEAEEWLMHITCAGYGVSPTELGFVSRGSGLGGKGFAEIQQDASTSRDIGLAHHVDAKLNRVIATDPPYGLGQPELEFAFEDLEKKEDRLAEAQALQIYWELGATTSDWIAENILDQDSPGLGPVIAYGNSVMPLAQFLKPPEPVVLPAGPGGPPPETPSAAPGELTGDEAVGEAVTKAAGSDLERWLRKAIRAAKDGRDPTRFASDEISPRMAADIRQRLAKATSVDEVRGAFVLAKVADPGKAKAEATEKLRALYADWFHEQGPKVADQVATLAKVSGPADAGLTRRAKLLSAIAAKIADEDAATDERLAKSAQATEDRFAALTQTFADGIAAIAERPVQVTVPAPVIPASAIRVTVVPTPVVLPSPPPPSRKRVERDRAGRILRIIEEPVDA